MKKNLLLFLVLMSLSLFYCFSVHAQDRILGKWISEKKDIVLEIYKEGSLFFGKVAWVKTNNLLAGGHEVSLQSNKENGRRFYGTEILSNLSYSSDNSWENGQLYDPNTNRTQNCQLWLDKNNSNVLYIRSYNLLPILGTTTVWTRPESSHPVYSPRYMSNGQ